VYFEEYQYYSNKTSNVLSLLQTGIFYMHVFTVPKKYEINTHNLKILTFTCRTASH